MMEHTCPGGRWTPGWQTLLRPVEQQMKIAKMIGNDQFWNKNVTNCKSESPNGSRAHDRHHYSHKTWNELRTKSYEICSTKSCSLGNSFYIWVSSAEQEEIGSSQIWQDDKLENLSKKLSRFRDARQIFLVFCLRFKRVYWPPASRECPRLITHRCRIMHEFKNNNWKTHTHVRKHTFLIPIFSGVINQDGKRQEENPFQRFLCKVLAQAK